MMVQERQYGNWVVMNRESDPAYTEAVNKRTGNRASFYGNDSIALATRFAMESALVETY